MSTSMITPESKYKSMFKSSKILWKNNKTTPISLKEGEQSSSSSSSSSKLLKIPTMKLPSPSMPSFNKKDNPMMLRETGKNEVYELSTVNDSGVYLPPQQQHSIKHDHWLDEVTFSFVLPSQDCLTTVSGCPHSFYTPSSVMITA
ncbi:uncharacterized protein BX664DRAFT_338597 [Halteromyces radiatus]|uniref:uncharacterized protein n=1 Tax=Halteromyces radiatus TaxID=101107 RepID=UPI002220787A|nr:uncharacterized protein BX664DRAFT_338597 [Halteromyces radiatus]KAI8085133.1 hypothetical protein BX664DRAFT_338597 [Halteromyces radiatus]